MDTDCWKDISEEQDIKKRWKWVLFSAAERRGPHISSYIYTTGVVLDELEASTTLQGDRRIGRHHWGGFRTRGGTTPQSVLIYVMPARLNPVVRPSPHPPGRDPQLQPDMPTLRHDLRDLERHKDTLGLQESSPKRSPKEYMDALTNLLMIQRFLMLTPKKDLELSASFSQPLEQYYELESTLPDLTVVPGSESTEYSDAKRCKGLC